MEFTVERQYMLSIQLMLWRLQEAGHQRACHWPPKPQYSVSSMRRVKFKSHKTLFPYYIRFTWPRVLDFFPQSMAMPLSCSVWNFSDWKTAKWVVCKRDLALNTLSPRQNGRLFPDDISNGFSRMKMFTFRLKFHWSLFLRVQLIIFQHWFR